MSENGRVSVNIVDGIGSVTFYHPKGNSLPGALLTRIAEEIKALGENNDVRVIVLKSEGDKIFCGGASFDEFKAISNEAEGKKFFMGFSKVILAMIRNPKFVIARVQGKAVGGAVGVLSASDYAIATNSATIKLSELALGIGPFIIAPVLEKRFGFGAYSALSVDTEWRSAEWAERHGLFAQVHESIEFLDDAVDSLARKIAGFNPDGVAHMKRIFWEGTENWEVLLERRAEISGRLVLSEYTKRAISGS